MVQPNILNRGSPTIRRLTLLATLASNLSLAASAHAATYSIAPGGNFNDAISKLNPGDTLLLQDGSYPAGSPTISVNCGGFAGTAGQKNAKSGMPGAPITLKAEHERQAFFQQTGQNETLYMSGCSYWAIEGLTIQSRDNNGSILSLSAIDIKHSNHITIRRNLFNRSNRYINGDIGVLLNYVDDSLVEENETYSFHRHANINKYGDRNVFRRNYSNSRDDPVIPGSWNTPVHGGDGAPGGGELVSIYPGNNVITENNIAERQGGMIDEQSIASSTNNRQFGNIGLNVHIFTHLQRRPRENPGPGSQNSYVENIVGIGTDHGVIERGGTNAIINHASVFAPKNNGVTTDAGALLIGGQTYPASPLPLSTHVTNSLVTGAGGYAFYFTDQASFGVDHSNLINNAHDFYPASSPTYTNNMSKDPAMGSCKVFIPDGSPMKGAGQNGEDIGANIVCRYENGVLQVGNPLWDPATGKFPCGAIYQGINDKPGESCFDVNVRLNVNANGCQLPPASSCKPVQLPDFPPVVGGPPPAGVFYSPDGKVCPSGYSSR